MTIDRQEIVADKPAKKCRWEFIVYRDDGEKEVRDDRYYIAPTINAACTKLLSWIRRQENNGFQVTVDYEARACHLPDTAPHGDYYPDLTTLDHEIKEFIR